MAPNQQEGFFRNAILLRDDGTRHRLLRMVLGDDTLMAADGVPDGDAWLIYMDTNLALPYYLRASEVRAQFKPFEAKEATSDLAEPTAALMRAFSKAMSPAAKRVADRAWARIEPLVTAPGIFEPSTRNALLKARSQDGGGSPKTMLKDLRRYWQGGQTQDALIGLYENSGRRELGTAGRGSRTADGDLPYQATQEDLDNMRWVIEDYYFDKEVRRTLTEALDHLHFERYTYLDGNGTKCLRPKRECPSINQLRFFLKTNYTLEQREISRKGEKRFALEDRSTEGSIQLECHGVGHIYEFDATIVDVPLAATDNPENIIGKPTLYLIIDRHSRMIVGYYIGFENASYSPAMLAILSIGENKEKLCQRLEIPYDKADWVAHGVVPEMFLADQGELVKKEARRIAMSLRSTISNVPGMRPDWKPLVECGFAMLHQIIRAETPAYVPDAENKKRRGINRDKDVCLTIEEFEKVIVRAIIAHNKTPQDGYPLTKAQVNDGVRPIPRELWAHSILRRMGVLDQMDYETLREELTPRDDATITEDGILYKGLYYSCPEAKQRGWLVEGRRKRKPLKIAFDYRLVDNIIVYNPNGTRESYTATLVGDSVEFVGCSFAQVAKHFSDAAKLGKSGADAKRNARYEYRQGTKPIIDGARTRNAAATKGVSRSSRKADTAPARSRALTDERKATPLIPAPNNPAPAVAATPQPPAPNVIPLKQPATPQSNQVSQPVLKKPETSPVPAAGASKSVQDIAAAVRARLLC